VADSRVLQKGDARMPMRLRRRWQRPLFVHADRPAQYAGQLSGPLRDRIDLAVDVGALPISQLAGGVTSESSAAVRARVLKARERQRRRGLRDGDDRRH
jgi:predicted ATPase with chaperone activity